MRRSASISDMFLEDAGGKEVMNTDSMLLLAVDARASWRLPTLATRAGALQTQQAPLSADNEGYYPPVQQRTRGQYRSRSGTTSSSVSSLEQAASTRLSGDSPEPNVFFMASSRSQPSHSNTSSSPRSRGEGVHVSPFCCT